jgi:hypothetical protein
MGLGRTNYVTIADRAGYDALMAKLDGAVDVYEKDGKVAFSGYSTTDDGDIPSWIEIEDEDGEIEEVEDLLWRLASFIADGEVLIYQTAGNDKARYCWGVGLGINNQGETVRVDIDDIYEKAAEHFGIEAKSITQANY